MSTVQNQVVPGECPCSPFGGNQSRNNGLFQRERRGAIRPHAIEHSYECQRQQSCKMQAQQQAQSAHRAEEGENTKAPPSSKPISTQTDHRGRDCSARQPDCNHQPYFGRRCATMKQINPEQHAQQPDAERAQESGPVNQH